MKFGEYIVILLQKMLHAGYRFTFGDFADSDKDGGHSEVSLHYLRLAADINLFKLVNGKWTYCTLSSDHEEFGKYWESLDPECAWGGRFNDGNHYSITYKGRK
jgi:hypothetical protein